MNMDRLVCMRMDLEILFHFFVYCMTHKQLKI